MDAILFSFFPFCALSEIDLTEASSEDVAGSQLPIQIWTALSGGNAGLLSAEQS